MCGIFGIIHNLNNTSIVNLIDIMENLKHRGKDSFGVSYINNNDVITFTTDKIHKLYNINKSFLYSKSYITHNRYSTSKKKNNIKKESQPLKFKNNDVEFSLVHNGNISNIHKYIQYDEYDTNLSDTQNIIKFFNQINKEKFEDMLIQFINTIHCSYNIIILYKDILYILRDRYGYKPLSIGLYNNNYCISSEDCINNFIKIRDVNPGEIIKMNNQGYKSIYYKKNKIELKCIFEFIYFMDQDSIFNNHHVLNIRKKLGTNLASMEDINFDRNNTIVVGSPNTAIIMGQAFSQYLNLEYKQLLVKENNCGRTFILLDQKTRKNACKKFIINGDLIKNKIIILVDDSIVRGNTLNALSKLFFDNACSELHIRICSPELKYPCYYGIDIPTKDELIINKYNIKDIEKLYNLNSLKYITLEKMMESFDNDNKFCTACFTGKYNKELEW
jgi:amidophosphoribosyltransferase